MFANYEKKIIEMTKSESKAAGKVGTTEYETLKELRSENPTFRIVIKASKSRDNMKGLDTNYMERYIKAHDDEEHSILKEFYSLRGLDENGKKIDFAPVAPYGTLKQWFLTYYPEVGKMSETVNEILAKAQKKREEAKKTTLKMVG